MPKKLSEDVKEALKTVVDADIKNQTEELKNEGIVKKTEAALDEFLGCSRQKQLFNTASLANSRTCLMQIMNLMKEYVNKGLNETIKKSDLDLLTKKIMSDLSTFMKFEISIRDIFTDEE